MRRKESLTTDGGSTSVQSNEEELNIWLEVTGGKNKKGRIYGFGAENEKIDDDLPSVNNTGGLHDNTVEEELRSKLTQLSQENEVLKQNQQELSQENEVLKQNQQELSQENEVLKQNQEQHNHRFEEMQQNFSLIASALQGMGIQLPFPSNTNARNNG